MKALQTFIHSSKLFKVGEAVDLPKHELDELYKAGLIGETKKQSKSKKDGNSKSKD